MRKKLTFLLLALFVSIIAMAAQEPTKYTIGSTEYWITDQGVSYRVNSENGAMELYGHNSNATDDDGNTVPTWDSKATNVEVEILSSVNSMPVTQIHASAFETQDCVTKVIIPESIDSIANSAFSWCSNLKEIYCYAKEPPTLGNNVFGHSYLTLITGAALYVPYGCKEVYLNDDPYHQLYGDIVGSYGNDLGWGDYFYFTATSSKVTYGPTFVSITEIAEITLTTGADGLEVSKDGTSITVTITTDDDVDFILADSDEKITITTTDEAGETTTVAYATAKQDQDGNWVLSFVDEDGESVEITALGEYTITIPLGYFTTNDGTVINDGATATFTIEEKLLTIKIDTENAELSEDGTSITVTITTDDNVVFSPASGDEKITITTGEGDEAETVAYATAEAGEGNTWTLNFVDEDDEATKVVMPGTYTITIPEGYFTTETGASNAEASAEFTIEKTPIVSEGDIVWVFNEGKDATEHPATIKEDIADDFTANAVVLGENISYSGQETITCDVETSDMYGKTVTFTKVAASTGVSAPAATDAVDFTLTLEKGKAFLPTSISLYACRCGTDNASIDVAWIADGIETKLITNEKPERNSKSSADYNFSYYSISEDDLAKLEIDAALTTCKLRVYLYNLGTKDLGLANICINGDVKDASTLSSITATWDWVNDIPEDIQSVSLEKTTGYVASNKPDVSLYVDASSGKLSGRTSGDAQFNEGTIIYVPVSSVEDTVTVIGDPNYYGYTIGGTHAVEGANTHTATEEEVAQGYVAVESLADTEGVNGVYLQSISVVLHSFTASEESFLPKVEDDAEVAEDGGSLTVTIDKLDLTVAEDAGQITVTIGEGDEAKTVAYAKATIHSGICTISFVDEEGVATTITTPGEYTITIPKGYFVDAEGATTEPITIEFTIEAPITIKIDAENSELSEDGTSITVAITDENGEDVELEVATDSGKMITITTPAADEGDDDVLVAYATAEQDETTGAWTLSFVEEDGETPVEITAAGTYTITIPEGYFTTEGGAVNAEATATFTIEEEPVEVDALFTTHFTDWFSLAETADDKVIPVTTATGGNFTFTLKGVSVNPCDVTQWNTDDEGNHTTAKFEGEGALIFGKASAETDVYYVETSTLGSVGNITFTEAVTGSSRGAKVLVKGAEDTEWETLYETKINSGATPVEVAVNRTDCQIRFENLAYNQNVYILDLKIYGTDGEKMTFDTALEIDPESGETLESLESFTISYQDGIELDGSSLQGYVVNEKGTNKAIFDFTKNSDNKGVQTSYTFTLYDVSNPEKEISLTADGTYTISIAEGAFRLGIYDETIDNDDKVTTGPIEITYIIGTGQSAKTEDFVLTPENGVTELEELSDFTVSCEMGIALTDEDLALEVTVGNKVVAIAKYSEGDEITDNDGTIGYNIKFYDPETGDAITLIDEATYSFTIPEGTFVYGSNDTKSEEIVIYYTIGELWFTFVPSDGSTVSSLESISVTNGLEGVGSRYLPYPEDPRETPTGLIVVLNEKNDTVATVPNYDDYVVDIWDESHPDDPDTEIIFNFDRPINTAGVYTVVIPKNIIFQGKRDVDSTADIYLTITVDGTQDNDTYQLYIELDDGALGDNSSLEDVWATIQEDYPESVEGLEATYDEISAEIAALRLDLLASYKAGTIEDDASEFETQITEIKTKINSLLETASGINGITTDAMSFEGKSVYTISGQKVSSPTKAGIYIIDGNKVVIK